MIDTKKEALEYYEHNPQDKESIFFLLVTKEQYHEVDDLLGGVCVIEREGNPDVELTNRR